ncbi:MAG: alpha/beta fold hydrolase [Armatimonadetes bacterium]|nr:alpha/beta fold hydrolase [Armatimonadota bacterium]
MEGNISKRALVLMMVACCLCLSALSCQWAGSREHEIATSRTFVDVGTHKLYAVLSDAASEYTIILESGGGMYSSAYEAVQDTLARLTGVSVLSYDRSGFGQSELGPDDLDSVGEVDALRTCLEAQGIGGKLILVGHSYGGLLVQLFVQRYPELVSGLVLIDPMNIEFVDRFGLDNLNAVTPCFDNPTTNHERAGNRMVDGFSQTLDEMRGKRLPTEKPVVLLTAGCAPFSPDVWRSCHEEMVDGSGLHRMMVAEGNHHDIVNENPELVVSTIAQLVSEIVSG